VQSGEPRPSPFSLFTNYVERLYEKASNAGQPPRHEANNGSIY
jgi:hypothetical protein